MPRIRMCDADREKYGGDEWLVLEMADIFDEETGVVEQVEEKWGLSPAEFLHAVSRGTVKGIRALMWVARWKQGIRDDPRTFRPRTQEFSGVVYEYTDRERALSEAGEAGPPANRAERRAAQEAAPKAPRKSTAASRRSSTGTGSGSSAS